jgi:uroporphyrinogen III methyltransferase / synthase
MTDTTIRLPLASKRIVVTRAREQASDFAGALAALGAVVIEFPTIEIRGPDSWELLDSAISRLDQFDFLIFTSVNGVHFFMSRLQTQRRDAGALAHLEIGAIGPATAQAARRAVLKVDFMPREYQAEGLLESLEGRDVSGKHFLIPRAKVARDLVPRVLTERGATVKVVEAYQTVSPRYAPGEVTRRLTPSPGVLTFTSSSTAKHFVEIVEHEGLLAAMKNCAIASIGPVTSQTLRELGLGVTVEARESTIAGLVAALVENLANSSS